MSSQRMKSSISQEQASSLYRPPLQQVSPTDHHTTLTIYDPYLPSDSSLSSSDIRLDPPTTQGMGGASLNEPFLSQQGPKV